MSNIYTLNNGKSAEGIAQALDVYLSLEQNMETQILRRENGELVVQARANGGKYKQWLGLDKVITATIKPVGNQNAVMEIGNGKWLDKGIAMAVSMFVLWPLTVTAGIGMYKQKKLPAQMQHAVEEYLAS